MKSAIEDRPLEKKSWETMKVSFLGKATELIQTGTGKLSIAGGDPGEGRKQSGGE